MWLPFFKLTVNCLNGETLELVQWLVELEFKLKSVTSQYIKCMVDEHVMMIYHLIKIALMVLVQVITYYSISSTVKELMTNDSKSIWCIWCIILFCLQFPIPQVYVSSLLLVHHLKSIGKDLEGPWYTRSHGDRGRVKYLLNLFL